MRVFLATFMVASICVASPASAQDFGPWLFVDNTDPFTDEMQLSLYTDVDGSIRGEAVLLLCTASYAVAGFNDGGFNVDQTLQVQIRIDDNPSWSFEGARLRNGAYSTFDIVIVQRIAYAIRDGESSLIYRAGSHTLTVPLRGATPAAQQFIESCPHFK